MRPKDVDRGRDAVKPNFEPSALSQLGGGQTRMMY